MIGRLRGILINKQPPRLLLEVGGVGYDLEAPMTTFYELPPAGQEVILHTHLAVREDAHQLYGFATETERAMFRHLIKVSGVGAKLALTILSGMSADDLACCVRDNDSARLVRLPGIGKKTAERLIVELRDRVRDWSGAAPSGMPQVVAARTPVAAPPDPVEDAVSALEALGYKPQEASRMVQGVAGAGLSSEQIIRAALQAAVKAS